MPEILDTDASYQSKSLGSQIVFQCKVFSEDYATIKWFKRVNIQNKTQQLDFVSYNGHFYELLRTANEKTISTNLYLSKLILNDLKEEDAGYYACLAISIKGRSVKEFHLDIKDDSQYDEDYWVDYAEEDVNNTDPKEFLLLFLMPLGLIILPLVVWYSYRMHKRCKTQTQHQKFGTDEAQYSEEDFSPDRCMLRV